METETSTGKRIIEKFTYTYIEDKRVKKIFLSIRNPLQNFEPKKLKLHRLI